MMDSVCEGVTVLSRVLEVIVEIVDMQVSVAEASAWCDVEIADNLVDSDTAFDPASFSTLRVETLCVPFPLTLLNIFALAKGPRD